MNRYKRVVQIKENYKNGLLEPDLAWPPEVQRAMSCIHSYLFDPRLTVGWMREQCGINGHNFSSRFGYYTGKMPKQYILYHRTVVVKQLLSELNSRAVSISGISYELGYAEPAAFTNAFKRMAGASPSVWRKRNR